MPFRANSPQPLDRRRFISLATAGAAALAAVRPLSGSLPSQDSELPADARAGDWPMFGNNIRGTRSNPHETLIGPHNVAQLKVKWTFEEARGFSQSTPIVVGDSLYFTAHDGHVWAVDTRSGRLRWKFDAWEGIQPDQIPLGQSEFRSNMFRGMRGSVAYGNGRIYVGDATARFHCLDAESGKEIWRTVMDPLAGKHQSLISASPIVYGEKIFIGLSTTSGRAHIACLDANTGAVRWRFDTVPDPEAAGGGAVWTAAALDPETGTVYNVTGSIHGHVPGPMLFSESMIANDMESGELLWYDQLRANDPFDLDYSCHPMLFEATHPEHRAARRRCVGAGSKTGFHTFDRDTGEHLWTAAVTNGGAWLNSTAYGRDKVYMVSNGAAGHRQIAQSATVALHAWTGEVLWWTPNASTIQGAAAYANGLFYQGFRDGTLQALDGETGEPLWTYQLPAPRRGGIVISNGTLYTICGGTNSPPYAVYAFSL
ncbi:MAG: PQQ-binding-like beta-propeller repeat protein [Acidobacteriota bacterium]|nr:PQQ-binding-like beta-propeller repeat protein [Acidobacteriota bacterium]